MKRLLLLAVLCAAPGLVGWTFLVDNFIGLPLDYVTMRAPANGDVPTYNSTTGKWEAAAGGGGGGTTIDIQTGGVAQGSTGTLNFTNGLLGSGGTTGNVSPTYGTSANTFTQGNDVRHNVTPAAGVRGNIAAVDAAGTAWTSIDEGTATDQALMSLGANTPGAFRALLATDIDELLASTDLTDFSTAKTGTGTSIVSNVGPTITGTTVLSIISAADQSANAASAGLLQRNGAELSWHNGTAATNLEQVGRKNAASGYAGLSAGSKLTASQGQEVWASTDLTDVSAVTGTGSTMMLNAGPTLATFVLITDSAGAAGAAGRLQRNGAELSWHNGTAATNLEQVGRKDVASGYAGLTASTKLNAAQGQEVWSISDLTDVAAMTEAAGDILSTGAGTTWDRLAKGANSTVLQVSSGGTLQYSTVTNAMLAGSITGDKISTVPNALSPVSDADVTWSAGATNRSATILPTGTGRAKITDTFGTYLIPGTVFINSSDIGTVSDTTSLTSYGTIYTLPANSVAAGRIIVIKGDLTFTAGVNATQSILLDCRLGSTTVHDFGTDVFIATANAASNIGCSFEIRLYVRASGAGGTLFNGGNLVIGREGSSPQDRGNFKSVVGTSTTAIDWTAAQAITVRGAFGNNTAGSETSTLRNVSVAIE